MSSTTSTRGVELDPLGFNPFIREQEFDCDSKTQTVALQSEYIQKMLKFWIDRFVIDICDSAKIEDMPSSFTVTPATSACLIPRSTGLLSLAIPLVASRLITATAS